MRVPAAWQRHTRIIAGLGVYVQRCMEGFGPWGRGRGVALRKNQGNSAGAGLSDVTYTTPPRHDSGISQQLIPWRGSEAGNVIPLGQSRTPCSQCAATC